MAYRDRSQGLGFVYVDIAKLLANRQEQLVSTAETKVINFNKDPEAVSPASADASRVPAHDRTGAMTQIRQNLDRLQRLHHKLHAMLEELNQITDKKKA